MAACEVLGTLPSVTLLAIYPALEVTHEKTDQNVTGTE